MADYKLQPKQELFAQEVVKNGGDKVKARADAGYSVKMSNPSQGKDADDLYNHPKIAPRIAELQLEADKVAKESFSISVEWRLKALKNIHDAGVTRYKDGNDVSRYENLAASSRIARLVLGIFVFSLRSPSRRAAHANKRRVNIGMSSLEHHMIIPGMGCPDGRR